MKISDITFKDFDIVTERYPIRIGCDAGIELRGIERLQFRNFRIKSKFPVSLEGSYRTILKDIEFSGISGEVDGESAITAKCVRNLKLNDFEVTAKKGPVVPFQRMDSESWETKF